MRVISFIILSFIISPGLAYALDNRPPEKTTLTRALFGFSKSHSMVKGKTDSAIIIWLKEMGFNAVFCRPKEKSLIESLHKAGIKVYVEYSLFVGEGLWQKYPLGRPVTSEGKPLKKYNWYAGVNPTVKEVRSEKLKGIRSLVEETEVDGIWLDFIRWPCHWEVPEPEILQTSFDEPTIKKFAADAGLSTLLKLESTPVRADKIIKDHLDKWTRWKCEQITSFVAETRKIADSAKSKILLGAFTVPWTDSDHNGAIKTIIGQDYEALGKHLDVVSPMVYHRLCNRPADWIGEATTAISEKVTCDTWPVVLLADEPVKLPPLELEKAIKTALKAKGSNGIILFSMRDLDSDKARVIKDTLSHF